jgi:5-methylcytosine-specific restriction endonuclease McrA
MADAILSEKTCRKCGVKFSGVRCKDCQKLQMAKYYEANKSTILERCKNYRLSKPDEVRACISAWYLANRDRALANAAEYRLSHKGQTKAYGIAWNAVNPGRSKARSAKWALENKDRRRSTNAAWYAANKLKINKRNSAWKRINPEVVRIYAHNRRTRMRNAGGKLSLGLAKKLFKLQRGKCMCCGRALGKNYHLDHIMPIAMGGANEDWNIQLLRQKCNNQKSVMHPTDWMQRRGFLI